MMRFAIWGFLLSLSLARVAESLPTREQRGRIFDRLTSEMMRLDGEALLVRSSRRESWKSLVAELRNEILEADTPAKLVRGFRRLDAAYPNLHSSVEFGDALSHAEAGRVRPKVRFFVEWLAEDATRVRVSQVDDDFPLDGHDGRARPEPGDEVVAINGRSISEWLEENFKFCKMSLRSQCDHTDFRRNFLAGLLSWSPADPLVYTLRRKDRVWNVNVPVRPVVSGHGPSDGRCSIESERYHGFALKYSGNKACVYEKEDDPSTALLRITSFHYRTAGDDELIRSVEQEIDQLLPWWRQQAAVWTHLIIDVTDNGGGQAPIPYYRMLLTRPFQEQYVTFRKVPELENAKLRRALFWGTPAQEIWFEELKKSGIWLEVPWGAFLPPVPMFCADDRRSCSEGRFEPFDHPFRGRISVIVNSFCVSSCDGFVYTMKEVFGERVEFFGHPQAADSAYSRLTLDVVPEGTAPSGYEVGVRPIDDPMPDEALLSQTVVVTRSVRANGEVVSGRPVPLDGFVPLTLENEGSWIDDCIKRALEER